MDYEKILKQLGKNIQEIRISLNLSQYKLTTIAKIDRSYLCRAEKGEENLTLGYIIKISKRLKIPISSFIRGI